MKKTFSGIAAARARLGVHAEAVEQNASVRCPSCDASLTLTWMISAKADGSESSVSSGCPSCKAELSIVVALTNPVMGIPMGFAPPSSAPPSLRSVNVPKPPARKPTTAKTLAEGKAIIAAREAKAAAARPNPAPKTLNASAIYAERNAPKLELVKPAATKKLPTLTQLIQNYYGSDPASADVAPFPVSSRGGNA